MSSREIAELTGKRHDSVLVDIRTMLEQLGGGVQSFLGSYLSEQNKRLPLYLLPYRETTILMTGYSIPMRAKVIDRWQELERAVAAPAFAVPTSLKLRESL